MAQAVKKVAGFVGTAATVALVAAGGVLPLAVAGVLTKVAIGPSKIGRVDWRDA